MSAPRISFVSATLLTLMGFTAAGAVAQQMGREGYGFPARNASMAAQFQFQERQNAANAASVAAQGAVTQYVTTYSSSSTAIGNLNEITQILSGGATGTVSQVADQDSEGNQGSVADNAVRIDNSQVQRVGAGATATQGP